mgnify:FL=1
MSATEQPLPRVALRFDVDTFQCMHRGVPRLLHFADKHQIPMTFFVNMGHAVNYRDILRKLGDRRHPRATTSGPSPKLSTVKKLGLRGTLHTLLTNPPVGLSSPLLPEIESRGHEIGLHGGLNHADWQNSAHTWSTARLSDELDWGLSALERAGVSAPRSFASPGWNSPASLPSLLTALRFTILADRHSPDDNACGSSPINDQLRSINTNLVGEPGGVGYIEHCEARQLSVTEMITDAESRLHHFNDIVMYDHPAYAGGRGLARLQALVETFKKQNAHFLTINQLD